MRLRECCIKIYYIFNTKLTHLVGYIDKNMLTSFDKHLTYNIIICILYYAQTKPIRKHISIFLYLKKQKLTSVSSIALSIHAMFTFMGYFHVLTSDIVKVHAIRVFGVVVLYTCTT